MVRALFPRSNLSVLSRGRFGGGHKPVLLGLPLLATHFATRTVCVDRVRKGVHNGAKSGDEMGVPSPLSHPHHPASSVYGWHGISSTCGHKYTRILSKIDTYNTTGPARSKARARKREHEQKQKGEYQEIAYRLLNCKAAWQTNPAFKSLIHHPQRVLK